MPSCINRGLPKAVNRPAASSWPARSPSPPEGLPPGAPPLKVDKPGHPYPEDTVFVLLEKERYVSRGAYKLLTILGKLPARRLRPRLSGRRGQHRRLHRLPPAARRRPRLRVDVGKNQLHEKLRADARVVNLEGVNLRSAPPELIPEPVDLVVGDVSFISLTLVLPPCMQWLRPGGRMAMLIKPQFELGPGETVKGVVRDEAARRRAVDKILTFCRDTLGLACLGVLPAAIRGPKGNQEYMACSSADFLFFLSEGERETVLKNGSPSPPRAPPHPSQNFYRASFRSVTARKTPRGCHVPRRDDKQEAGRQ